MSSKKKTLAIYPGTFDPITMGHLDIVDRALDLFDKVIIAIAINPSKTPLFSLEERIDLARKCFPEGYSRIEVAPVSGLIVDFAEQRGAKAIVRGLRAVSDFDYEFQLALMNRKLKREVDTLFLMPAFRWIYISSSIIKDASRHGGNVSEMVPEHVNQRLKQIFSD
ncbi:MAG: pantetheine-phosphate adenylyltransferase [Desulfobulbaceae bacterium]|uniref:Phosphopantetheine adenylyltransferase n=1 Tax=Candidatus Desulfatifera sulfidica TaxID=2841691 RepID=A0A8J6N7C2_9BACT|nr:pantetheine-phosphate adenylyltransferase [Candidatus Desulfatifera sulfidica]